ncbi:acetylornithine aminotransferase [Irineochytrium annulatum]|nr:acetylornithine aminotransferase [Irineochytrium annulatum]
MEVSEFEEAMEKCTSLIAEYKEHEQLLAASRIPFQLEAARRSFSTNDKLPEYPAVQTSHPDENPNASQQTRSLRTTLDALLPLYPQPTPIFTHGQGCTLFDSDNRAYLDLTAGIAVTALGHNDLDVADAVIHQSQRIIHLSNLYRNEYAGELASLLINAVVKNESRNGWWSAGIGAKAFFCNSGTEANEGAIKFARKYAKIHRPGGASTAATGILSFSNAFHGRTMGSLSATPNTKYQTPFTPLIPGFTNLPYNDLAALDTVDFSTMAAVIVEPVQGEGGVNVARSDWLRELRRRCDSSGCLLVFDEIQCGLGRTGKFLGHHHVGVDDGGEGVDPDMITLAKPLANGLPIGAVLLTGRVAEGIAKGDHGTTFGGGPLVTRVGGVVVRKILEPAFLDGVRDTGAYFAGELEALAKQYPTLLGEVRGRGLLLGVQMQEGVSTSRFVDLCRLRGVLVITAANNTIRVVPPLVISKADINKAVGVFKEAIAIMAEEASA